MSMLLKRYFWVVPATTTMLCSYLGARAATSVIDAQLSDGQVTPRRQARSVPSKPVSSKEAHAVVGRNMFCSDCPSDRPGETRNTPLPLILAATVVSPQQGIASATILNVSSFKAGAYGVGDWIPDVGPIVDIKPKWVDFENIAGNRRERIALGRMLPVAATPEPGNGIRKIDDTHYEIDRVLVETMLGDPSVAMRQVRIVPSRGGFTLQAVRPSSVFANIGLQNGDTVVSINGLEMRSLDDAFEAYTKMRSLSNLSLSILRRGQAVSLEYAIK